MGSPSMSESAPGNEVFGEDDLAPPEWEVRARRRARIDRAAVVVAVLALGVWAGGLVALGACAAPLVFGLTPFPFSADAMGAVFARFDKIAVGAAIVVLGCEVVRTIVDMKRGARPSRAARARRYLAMLAALMAVYGATQLTPGILRLHRAGVRRNVGPDGQELETLHKRAELIGKALVPLAAVLVALHVATLRSPRDEEEDENQAAAAPLPPGPRKKG
jgi:hypothetical protein